MTLSLAAVFIPVLFLGGVLGRLFKEFAVTITVAILISGVVSVTLTPMLCSRFLKAAHEEKRGWFYRITEKFFDGMLHTYDVTLKMALRHRVAMMVSFVLVLGATVYMFIHIPKGFIPDQDTDQLTVITEAGEGTSYYQMVTYEQQIADAVAQDPNVESLFASSAAPWPPTWAAPITASSWCTSSRAISAALGVNEIIKELRPKLDAFAGMKIYLQNPPTIRIGGQVTKSLYQFSMQTPDKPELYDQTAKLTAPGRKAPRRGRRHQRRRRAHARRSTSPSTATRPAPWA